MLPQVDELVIPPKERKTIQTLKNNDCRWPIGDPQHADFHFCGKPTAVRAPYCEFHMQRGWQPSRPRAPYQPRLASTFPAQIVAR
jgi:GcrA cell cycle regulator